MCSSAVCASGGGVNPSSCCSSATLQLPANCLELHKQKTTLPNIPELQIISPLSKKPVLPVSVVVVRLQFLNVAFFMHTILKCPPFFKFCAWSCAVLLYIPNQILGSFSGQVLELHAGWVLSPEWTSPVHILWKSCWYRACRTTTIYQQNFSKREAPLCLILSPKDKSDPDPKQWFWLRMFLVTALCAMVLREVEIGKFTKLYLALHFVTFTF